MCEIFGMRVSLAILPVDSFTGKVIRDPGFWVCVNGAGRPVIKAEGYRVFTAAFGARATAELCGRFYQSMRIEINLAALAPGCPVAVIRMLPGRDYPFPKETVFLEGKLPGHAVLTAAVIKTAAGCKLRLDCAAGDKMIAVHQKPAEMVYLIMGKSGDKEEQEWIELTAVTDEKREIYALKDALCYSYRCRNAVLYPAVRYEADAAGRECFLALAVRAGKKALVLRCRLEADGRLSDETFLAEAGKTIKI